MKNQKQYFNLIEAENSGVPEILIYGYIGFDWWALEDEKQNTAENLATIIKRLEKNHPRINIRINSFGGDMGEGNAIVNAIKNSSSEIHTYNDGLCASMAAVIWCAGHKRHMAANGLNMFHSALSWIYGNADDFRREADVLDKFNHTILTVVAQASGKTDEEVKTLYLDYKDHWLTFQESVEAGLINTSDNDYEGQPEEAAEHVQDFESKAKENIFRKIKNKIRASGNLPEALFSNFNPLEENMKGNKANPVNDDAETQQDLTDVTESQDEIKSLLETLLAKVEVLEKKLSPETEPANASKGKKQVKNEDTATQDETITELEDQTNENTDEIEELKKQIEELKAMIEKSKEEPGTEPAALYTSAETTETKKDKYLDEFNKDLIKHQNSSRVFQ